MRPTITEGKRLMTKMSILILCIQSIISATTQHGNTAPGPCVYEEVLGCQFLPSAYHSRQAEQSARDWSNQHRVPMLYLIPHEGILQGSVPPVTFHNRLQALTQTCLQIISSNKRCFRMLLYGEPIKTYIS